MKLLLLLLLFPILSYSQNEPILTGAFIGEYSVKPVGPTGYMGMAVQAGIWAGSEPNWPNIGVMAGYVEYKANDTTPAHRSAVVTLALRMKLLKENLQISPYFSFLSDWHRDIGIRAGWKIQQGTYAGITISETMHLGIGVVMSIW